MPYFPHETIAHAKQIDLLPYMQFYEPQELVKITGGTYCTREHDSLRISNGRWCWFSRGVGGRSALDYLIKVKGFAFINAVEQIVSRAAIMPPIFAPKNFEIAPKKLLLPKANSGNSKVISYLQNQRGISTEIINYCINTGKIYQSFPYNNAVFVGTDKQGTPRHAALRGINFDFKGDAKGSNKRYAFSLTLAESNGNNTLHVFESAIDLLSFTTLQLLKGNDWKNDKLLSLAGVYQPQKQFGKNTLPTPLTQYLSDYPCVNKIILHLDNDATGRGATKVIMAALSQKYKVFDCPPPVGNDFNDTLLNFISISKINC